MDLSSEHMVDIWERKVTTAKANKEMWTILRSLTINLSVPIAQIITDNGKTFVSQKQKADVFVRLSRDVSNL